jgi:hypothetical protein
MRKQVRAMKMSNQEWVWDADLQCYMTESKDVIILIDKEDYPACDDHTWSKCELSNGSYYIQAGVTNDGVHLHMLIERLVMNAKPGETVRRIDASDKCIFDARRKNLVVKRRSKL